MPTIHRCDLCDYETSKTSTYKTHIASTRHLNKLNGISSIVCSEVQSQVSAITEATMVTDTRIQELENQITILKMEYEMKLLAKDAEIKQKDLELKHKDEIISLLRNAPPTIIQQEPQNNNVTMVVQEKKKPTRRETSTIKEHLMKTRPNAPTIEECRRTLMYNSEYNNYIQDATLNGTDYIILDPSYIRHTEFQERGIDNAINIVKAFFRRMPENDKPFYCSDKRRNILYLKTNEGWIKQNTENKNAFEKMLLQLAKDALNSIHRACCGILTVFKKNESHFQKLYGMTFSSWNYGHINEIYNNCSLIASNVPGISRCDEDDKNERLVVKQLKVLLNELSTPINESDTESQE